MPRARFWIVVQSHTDILASLLACHQVEHRGSKVNHCDRRHISALGLSRSPATRPRWFEPGWPNYCQGVPRVLFSTSFRMCLQATVNREARWILAA